MFNVLIQKCRKKYDIVYVNFDKITKIFQHKISLFLYICERIFKFHYCHVKLFLISMNNDRLFVTIFFWRFIDRNISEHRQLKYDCIQSRLLLYRFETTWNMRLSALFDLIHEYLLSRAFFFRFVVLHHRFSNHENWIFKKNESRKSFHFFLFVKFVKNLVYEFLIFHFHWVNAISFVIVRSIWFERYRHVR